MTVRKLGPFLSSAAIALIGLLPMAWVLPLLPMSRDAVIWMDKSRWSHPKFVEWVFRTQHFKVGYRPVTALSYTTDHLLGDAVWIYRVTDFSLHFLACLLVFGLVRALAPSRSPWNAVAASALMALHPLASIVVPHIARRGYSLATAFSLAALWLITRNDRRADALAIGALALGALSNEAAYVALPVAALMLWERGRAGWSALAGLGATLGALLAARVAMIGGIGGYAVADDRAAKALTAGLATWTSLMPIAVPDAAEGEVLPGPGVTAAAVGLGAALLASTLPRAREDRASTWMAAWLVGLTLVYLPNGVWFPRQVYMLVAPLAVLVGLQLGAGPRWSDPARWVAAGVLALCLGRSVVVRGPDPDHQVAWRRTDATTRRMMEHVASAPRRDEVWTVTPFTRRPGAAALKAREGDARRRGDDPLGSRISEQWTQLELHRKLTGKVLVYQTPAVAPPYFHLSREGESWRIDPVAGVDLSVEGAAEPAPAGSVRLTPPPGTWLYVDDGVEGRLLPPP